MNETATLSPRQRECLHLYWTRRATSKEIAERLGLAPSTVDAHLGAAVQALGARNRREAGYLAFGNPSENRVEEKTRLPEAADVRPLLPLRTGVHNDLTIAARLFWIVALAVLLAVGFGALASGARTISDLFR